MDTNGRPMSSDGQQVRGLCTRPYDCNECLILGHEVAQHPPDEVTWVCPTCIRVVLKSAKENRTPIAVPGFFSEGHCEYPSCPRPANEATGDPAKYSVFRQIVFGPIR